MTPAIVRELVGYREVPIRTCLQAALYGTRMYGGLIPTGAYQALARYAIFLLRQPSRAATYGKDGERFAVSVDGVPRDIKGQLLFWLDAKEQDNRDAPPSITISKTPVSIGVDALFTGAFSVSDEPHRSWMMVVIDDKAYTVSAAGVLANDAGETVVVDEGPHHVVAVWG